MENRYFISKEKNESFKYSEQLHNYYINHDYEAHEISVISHKNKTLVLIGDFINAHEPHYTLKQNAELLFESGTIHELIQNTNYFAGRYIVLFGKNSQLEFVLSDPVSSIPVNYSFINNEVQLSSHAYFIADKFSLRESSESIRIKSGAEQQQPLPYNLSMYEDIKVLIPNHYLDLQNKSMKRFFPTDYLPTISMDEAVLETIKYTKSALKGYFATRNLSLPITSGLDSRTVLALMKDHVDEIEMYTFYLDGFSSETGDIRIPKEISSELDTKHHILPVIEVPDDLRKQIYKELGGLENDAILNQAYTYKKSQLSGTYSVPGEIITLSKSLFGKNLPDSFATLEYLMTKTHNHTPEARNHVKIWIDHVKDSAKEYNVSLFDLFAHEHRLGRWLPNSIQNYDYFIDQIYIFNMRHLVKLWMSISKKERTKRSLHLEIIKKEWPELLNCDINPDDKIRDKFFSNSYLFYVGSHLKHLLDKRNYKS